MIEPAPESEPGPQPPPDSASPPLADGTSKPTEQQLLIAHALVKESDRGCVILGASWLAEALEHLIKAYCRHGNEAATAVDPLFQGYAPLATFSARIQVAYALGILPFYVRDQITIVRRLRNIFAHEWGPVDFDDPRCAERLALLIGRRAKEEDGETELDQAGEPSKRVVLPGGASKKQLINRIAFVLAVGDMVSRMKAVTEEAANGSDVRRMVRFLEQQYRQKQKMQEQRPVQD